MTMKVLRQGLVVFVLLSASTALSTEAPENCEAQSTRPSRKESFRDAFSKHFGPMNSLSRKFETITRKLRTGHGPGVLRPQEIFPLFSFANPAHHSRAPTLATFEESLAHINSLLGSAATLRASLVAKLKISLPFVWDGATDWMPLVDRSHLETLIERVSSYVLSSHFDGHSRDRSFHLKFLIDQVPTFQRILGDDNETLIRLARIVPHTRAAPRLVDAHWKQLPKAWKKSLREHWIGKENPSPRRWPRLKGLHLARDGEAGEMCGTCSTMDKGHWDSAMDVCGQLSLNDTDLRGHHAGQRIVIGDQVVGLFKRRDAPSFLAVNGFSDPEGRPVLVPGMVYTLSNEMLRKITTWNESSEFRYPLTVFLPADTELLVSPMISFHPSHCAEVSGKCFIDFMSKLSNCIALTPPK